MVSGLIMIPYALDVNRSTFGAQILLKSIISDHKLTNNLNSLYVVFWTMAVTVTLTLQARVEQMAKDDP